jgi:hypothetical protein
MAMRTRAARDRAQDEYLDAHPCSCGHSIREHHEYRSSWEIVNGEPTEVRHPRYRPALFRCDHCECER